MVVMVVVRFREWGENDNCSWHLCFIIDPVFLYCAVTVTISWRRVKALFFGLCRYVMQGSWFTCMATGKNIPVTIIFLRLDLNFLLFF